MIENYGDDSGAQCSLISISQNLNTAGNTTSSVLATSQC